MSTHGAGEGETLMLACPFCGGAADGPFSDENGLWWVQCTVCSASNSGGARFRERAIAAWSRRAAPADAPREVNQVEAFRAVEQGIIAYAEVERLAMALVDALDSPGFEKWIDRVPPALEALRALLRSRAAGEAKETT